MSDAEIEDATRVSDPLTSAERTTLLDAPRPKRRLPLADDGGADGHRDPLAPFARAIDQRTRPIYAVWELTLACDLACRHCGSRAGDARPDELTTEEALHLVGQMADLGVREVTLIGGEAYLHHGWTQVVAEIRKRGMQSTMVTGGRGMTKERAAAAAAAGVESIAVSIDGTEVTHDRLRGVRGAYAAALAALDHCRDAGMQIAVNTQINRLSMPDLSHVFDVLVAVDAHGWQLQLTVPAGRAADEPDVVLQPYDLLECMPVLARLKEKCEAANIKLFPGNNVGYFGPFEHVLRGRTPAGYRGACSAGRVALGIESNGDIKGCPSLPTQAWVGGNIRHESLRDIWERSKPLRYTRDRTTADLWGYCAGCYYADVCMGGCTWMASALFGKPGNNPYCHHRALEFQRQGKRERMQRVSDAPGLPFDHARWEIIEENFDS